MSYLPATHPEDVFTLAFRGLNLSSAGFSKVFFLLLIAVAFLSLPQIIAFISGAPAIPVTLTSNDIKAAIAHNRPWVFLGTFIAYIFIISSFKIMNCIETNTSETISNCLLVTLQRLFSVIEAKILSYALIIAPLFLLVKLYANNMLVRAIVGPIGFYLWFLFSLTTPILLTEKETMISSITKSIGLVFGNWWRTFIVMLLPMIFCAIIFLALAFLFACLSVLFNSGHMIDNGYVTIVLAALTIFFISWEIATILVLLHDLEFRNTARIDSH